VQGDATSPGVTKRILAARGAKNAVSAEHAYHAFVEQERTANGQVESVATVFLTNRECPFTCLMCDLWKNTLDTSVVPGAIPAQIRSALHSLPPARHIKLYNSGNFFDPRAIPRQDWEEIADCAQGFDSVIVENHPRMCGPQCGEFRSMLDGPELEVALGLETSHEPTLARLNKQMTVQDFARACETLTDEGIRIRTFVLLRPPETTEAEGIARAVESVRFAFDCGAECVAVIPTRPGNGILDQMLQDGTFESPSLRALEHVIDETVAWNRGRVFADLWDLERFATCPDCVQARINRLQEINLTQRITQRVECRECDSSRS